MDSRFSDFFNISGGCTIDGMAASCSLAAAAVNAGAAVEGVRGAIYNVSQGTFDHIGDILVDPVLGYAGFDAMNTGALGTIGHGGHAPDTSSVNLAGTGDSSVNIYAGADFASTGDPQKPNPNCITNAVQGGALGTARVLIPAIGPHGPTGLAAHDGIHVTVPAGTTAAVTALPAMAGRIVWGNSQDARLAIVDIELRTPINGQAYVLTLKDLNQAGAKLSGTITGGSALGSVTGTATEGADPGLHVTLMPKSVYEQYIYNYDQRKSETNRPSSRKRDSVPFTDLMDAARDPRSPFRCP